MISYDGILLCDKPFGMTSHKVIEKLRQVIGQKKIGHTGTLDPRATGLLIVCLGRATKIAQFLTVTDKTYEAEIKLGLRSTTFDSEGISENETSEPIPDLSERQVENVLKEFVGNIIQKVPLFSAIKMNGRRLHRLARQGKKIDPPEMQIVSLDKLKAVAGEIAFDFQRTTNGRIVIKPSFDSPDPSVYSLVTIPYGGILYFVGGIITILGEKK